MEKGQEKPIFRCVYPKNIPPVDKRDIVDEMGMNVIEKLALQHAYMQYKNRGRYHARQISIEYFLENENLLEKFRIKNGHFPPDVIARHPIAMNTVIGYLIENLGNKVLTRNVILDMVAIHREAGVNRAEMVDYAATALHYIGRHSERQSSISLIKAIEKLIDFIAVV